VYRVKAATNLIVYNAADPEYVVDEDRWGPHKGDHIDEYPFQLLVDDCKQKKKKTVTLQLSLCNPDHFRLNVLFCKPDVILYCIDPRFHTFASSMGWVKEVMCEAAQSSSASVPMLVGSHVKREWPCMQQRQSTLCKVVTAHLPDSIISLVVEYDLCYEFRETGSSAYCECCQKSKHDHYTEVPSLDELNQLAKNIGAVAYKECCVEQLYDMKSKKTTLVREGVDELLDKIVTVVMEHCDHEKMTKKAMERDREMKKREKKSCVLC
jgi:hypothetical protein